MSTAQSEVIYTKYRCDTCWHAFRKDDPVTRGVGKTKKAALRDLEEAERWWMGIIRIRPNDHNPTKRR